MNITLDKVVISLIALFYLATLSIIFLWISDFAFTYLEKKDIVVIFCLSVFAEIFVRSKITKNDKEKGNSKTT